MALLFPVDGEVLFVEAGTAPAERDRTDRSEQGDGVGGGGLADGLWGDVAGVDQLLVGQQTASSQCSVDRFDHGDVLFRSLLRSHVHDDVGLSVSQVSVW